MSEPRFLAISQVKNLHGKLIDSFGGTHGIRDGALVEGAVAQPQYVYFYERGDLFDIAAAYAFHIAQAQAFLDGNKRTGMAAALVFLQINGEIVPERTDELYAAMIGIAEKKVDRSQLAAILRAIAGA